MQTAAVCAPAIGAEGMGVLGGKGGRGEVIEATWHEIYFFF